MIAAATELGELRLAINNAGIGTPTKLVGRDGPTSFEEFAKVIAVNLHATINVLRCAAAAMVASGPEVDGGMESASTPPIAACEGRYVRVRRSKASVAGLTGGPCAGGLRVCAPSRLF